ncbi:NADH:flavin oxidoreductase [Streptomyces sulfonofaciens]|uniref:NADH:flavin oxidoreductase n=1 Tax=Streptomyces sulfonofaciens TaxID=68272 RepID=UPI001E46FCDE|nr:NADH:flavin oxidoreductase [Streptomyces sulfonofaciens]
MEQLNGQHTGTEDLLFTPFDIGAVRLRNRTALSPMTRISATETGLVTDLNTRYYAGFARGGFGLIITEGIYPDTEYSQGYLHQPGLATPEHARAWRPVVESVHAEKSAVFAQLMHAGAQSQGNRYRDESVGPSSVAPRGNQIAFYRGAGPYPTPRPLDAHQIRDIRRGFAEAARNALAAGFDGVELHGANGYLIDQFLTDYLNHREDAYGGTVENRVRLAAEVLDEVLQAVGSEIVVGIRISQSKVGDYDHRWAGGEEDAEAIFTTLARTGAHFVHTTEYRALQPAFTNSTATLASLAKRFSGLPVIVNGHLGDPRAARSVLESRAGDLVAIGKGALAQRDWPRRVRDGLEIAGEPHPDTFRPLATIKDWELEL